MVDAPVSGGSEGAQKATLSIFVGGEAADVERARPVLQALGTTITHVGPIGSGQAVKAVNQVILAGTYLGVAEGIVLAMKAGLDVEQVVGALGGERPRAGSSPTAAAGCSRTTIRSASRSRSTARTSGSRSASPARPARACRSRSWPRSSRMGSSTDGHGEDDMSALARSIRGRSGLPD